MVTILHGSALNGRIYGGFRLLALKSSVSLTIAEVGDALWRTGNCSIPPPSRPTPNQPQLGLC